MYPPYKQRLVDQINIHLEKQLFLLKTDKYECVEWYFILTKYYTDVAYRQRRTLGATTEFEDWFYDRETKTLPSQT